MSAIPPNLPPEVRDAAREVRRLSRLEPRTRAQEAELAQARLTVAHYACRQEGVVSSWDNLAFILGDGVETLRALHDQARAQPAPPARPAGGPGSRGDGAPDRFWGGAPGRK